MHQKHLTAGLLFPTPKGKEDRSESETGCIGGCSIVRRFNSLKVRVREVRVRLKVRVVRLGLGVRLWLGLRWLGLSLGLGLG